MKPLSFLLICALIVASLILTAGASPPPYVGAWELDTKRCSVGVGELYRMFGSSLGAYGAGMNIRADGTMDYYVGLTGGEGSYTADEDTLTADIRSWIEDAREELTIDLVRGDGECRLILHLRSAYRDVDLAWTKRK